MYPLDYEILIRWIGLPIIFAICYASWRTNGLSFTCVLLAFLSLPILGVGVPAELSPLIVDSNAMLGVPISIISGIVFMFILIGKALVHTGIVELIVGFITARVNNPARVAIISSAAFGSISGSAVSNVMSTGQLTIPLMIRAGFSKTRVAAYEAVASTGGGLTPPIMGAAAFLMAEMLMISYWNIALVAAVPAVVFYSILLFSVPNGDKQINKKQRKIRFRYPPTNTIIRSVSARCFRNYEESYPTCIRSWVDHWCTRPNRTRIYALIGHD